MSDTIKGFRGKDGPILLDYSGVANVPGAIQSIGDLMAQPGDHFEVETVDGTGRVATVKAVAKPGGGGSGQNPSQGGGMNATARNLLITILRNGQYISDQSGNITALAAALEVGSDSGDTPDNPVPDVPVGSEIVLADLEWVNGKTLYLDGWYDHSGNSVSAAVDVSGVASIKLIVAESQANWMSAPRVATVPDAESVAGFKNVPNNEGTDYVGGQYPYELTYDVTAADYVRFIVATSLIDKLTVTLEAEVE